MDKITIGICDDQTIVIRALERIISGYLVNKEIDAELVLFDNGEAVLAYEKEINILFLDIEMPIMDGIEVGHRIRNKKTDCKIIMATSRIDRFKDAFKIEAFRFVSKPFEKKEIENALDDALDTIMGFEKIKLYYKRIPYMIKQCDIKYVQAYDSYVEILVSDKKMRKESSVNKLEEILDKHLFYRVSRSYIVNMLHIDDYSKGIIYINEEKIKISRDRKKDFEKTFIEFDLKYRG